MTDSTKALCVFHAVCIFKWTKEKSFKLVHFTTPCSFLLCCSSLYTRVSNFQLCSQFWFCGQNYLSDHQKYPCPASRPSPEDNALVKLTWRFGSLEMECLTSQKAGLQYLPDRRYSSLLTEELEIKLLETPLQMEGLPCLRDEWHPNTNFYIVHLRVDMYS